MEDKNALVNSISNLINHIAASKKNQEEIFRSLTRKDLHKIISNLDDPYQKLRFITIVLLSELLYNNNNTKLQFCQLLDVHPSPGKIVVNKSAKMHESNPVKLREIFQLLKNTNIENHPSSNSCLWFIDLTSKTLKINFYTKEQTSVDPINCIVGFVVPKPIIPQRQIFLNNFFHQQKSKIQQKPTFKPSHKPSQSFSTTTTGSKVSQIQTHKTKLNSSVRIDEAMIGNEEAKMRMSIPSDDLIWKAKQGIKITSHTKQKSDLVEKRFENPKIETTYKGSQYKTIILGGNKGYETVRQRKNVSKFSAWQ